MRSPRLCVRAAGAMLVAATTLALPSGALAASALGVSTTTTTGTVTASSTTTSSTTTAPPVTLTSSSGGGLSVLQEVGIGIVALAVFSVVIFVIRRDARAHAPRGAPAQIDRERGTVAPRAERVKRSRAKAKAARRARRRSGR